MFRDRLNDLCRTTRVGYTLMPPTPMHTVLDRLDAKLGIRTRHGQRCAYHAGAKPFPQSEYVGARLARLERLARIIERHLKAVPTYAHVSANKTPYYFHLGAEGEA